MSHSPNAPVGVFDSGVGGVSVLKAILETLPAEGALYLSDAAFSPYGGRTEAEIRARSLVCTEFLISRGAKAVVVACNTATAAAVESLRERFTVPIVAMEPGIKPASAASRSGVIGVLATEATARSYRLGNLIERYARDRRVLIQPCPGLVDLIEAGTTDGPELRELVEGFVEPLIDNGADTLILGCTHYALIGSLIAEVAGEGVHIVDTGRAVARQLGRVLSDRALLAHGATPSVRFFTTGESERFEALLRDYWGYPASVEAVDPERQRMESDRSAGKG